MKRIQSFTFILTAATGILVSSLCANAGSFFSDFNSGLPPGMTVYGSATNQPSGGFTNSGYLQLTTASGGDAAIILNDLDSGVPIVSFTAQFKVLLGNPGGYTADGMSFNFAPDLPAGTYPVSSTGGAEEGAGTGYTIEFDTYLNGTPDTAPAIDVKVGSPDHSTYDGNEFAQAVVPGLTPSPEAFVDCVIQLNPNNTLTVCYDGAYIYSNLDLSASGYIPIAASQFGIAARTGGTKEDAFLDNLSIITHTNGTPFVNSFLPQGRVAATNSSIDIVLTDFISLAATNAVNTNTIALKLDGATVSPTITTNGSGDGNTYIHFLKPAGFVLGTTHSVSLTYSDSTTPTPRQYSWSYTFSTPAPPSVIPTTRVIFSDGFEGYVGNGARLDKNYADPNSAPNGSGNPWWGPAPPNVTVVTAGTAAAIPTIDSVQTGSMVTPHSGTNMISGDFPSDIDQEYYCLQYRLGGGQTLQGNFQVDWWFYDPLGGYSTNGNDSSYRDYLALVTYTNDLSSMDYPPSQSLPGVGISQRLSLGAAPNSSSGVNYDYYQARIVASSLGYNNGNFNTTTLRSVGWHHGRIALGPPTNSHPIVFFYIDDMVNPCVTPPPPLQWLLPSVTGLQSIELNLAFGNTFGFMDDLSISKAIPPNISPTLSGTNLFFSWPAGFTLQAAPAVIGPFSDISTAYTGFTYNITSGPQQFFRLRN